MSEKQKKASEKTTEVTEKDTSNKYELSLEAMLKSGVHFGHKKSRWNPKMKPFIFGVRNGVHVIDLEKSLVLFEKGLAEIDRVVEKNGLILFVGTKKQVKDLVKAVAEKLEMPYVNERWLGGTFTNFPVIKKRIKYLADSKLILEKGDFSGLTKLERNKLQKKIDKLEEKMGGLTSMNRLPDLIVVLDINKDDLAVKEARRSSIKTIGLLDTNSDPASVDLGVPANDDALSSLRYILGVIMRRVIEGREKSKVASNQ